MDETLSGNRALSSMVDLEDQLKKDESGILRDEVLNQIGQAALELKATLDKGVPLDDYKRLREVGLALESAQRIVETYWTRCNASTS